MFVMQYAKDGNLHEHLQKNFANIGWKEKIKILWEISNGYLYYNILTIKILQNTNFFFLT